MKKFELLSPAGNFEMLKMVIKCGADAVYLAGSSFGARGFADNFTNDELRKAIEYAHIRGVKVYITVNTLIHENEVEAFLKYIDYIYTIGVDAILLQDIGMLDIIKNNYPELEIHASTQMHNNSMEMIRYLKSKGVSRVVVDREMSIDTIKTLTKEIEIEVFVHGALCVSYSGECLFSSKIMNRSGNKGICAGMCRLKYKYASQNKENISDAKYYLSLKELNTSNSLHKILDTNVACLKIEGRMKSPEYAGYVTKLYKKIITEYLKGNKYNLSNEETKNLALLYNRGFTEGYILNSDDNNMNSEYPNHIGINLGKYKIIKNKIAITLDEDLEQFDQIRFLEESKGMTVNYIYNREGLLINSGKKGDTIFIDNFLNLKQDGNARKITSIKLNNEILNYPDLKIPLNGVITLKENEPIKIELNDGINKIIKIGIIPSVAINRPITKEGIIKNIDRLKNTAYYFNSLKVKMDEGLFINPSELNRLRTDAINELNCVRCLNNRVSKKYNISQPNNFYNRENHLFIRVNTEEQFNVAKKYSDFVFTSNFELYDKYRHQNLYLKIKESSKAENLNYVLSDYGSLIYIKDRDNVLSDYMLNVVNRYSIITLERSGVSYVTLSPELTKNEILSIYKNYPSQSICVLIYGKLELMRMKYGINKNIKGGYLVDRNNKYFPIKKENGLTYIMNYKPENMLPELEEYFNVGIKNFRIDFFDEPAILVEKILNDTLKIIGS